MSIARRMAALTMLLALAPVVGCWPRTPHLLRPPHEICPDGLPVKRLQHPACAPEGLCGYTCEPGRWDTDW